MWNMRGLLTVDEGVVLEGDLVPVVGFEEGPVAAGAGQDRDAGGEEVEEG
jgi:hypothetical protein